MTVGPIPHPRDGAIGILHVQMDSPNVQQEFRQEVQQCEVGTRVADLNNPLVEGTNQGEDILPPQIFHNSCVVGDNVDVR